MAQMFAGSTVRPSASHMAAMPATTAAALEPSPSFWPSWFRALLSTSGEPSIMGTPAEAASSATTLTASAISGVDGSRARNEARHRPPIDGRDDRGAAVEHGVLADQEQLARSAERRHAASSTRAPGPGAATKVRSTPGVSPSAAATPSASARATHHLHVRPGVDREERGGAAVAQRAHGRHGGDRRGVPVEDGRIGGHGAGVHAHGAPLGDGAQRVQVARHDGRARGRQIVVDAAHPGLVVRRGRRRCETSLPSSRWSFRPPP